MRKFLECVIMKVRQNRANRANPVRQKETAFKMSLSLCKQPNDCQMDFNLIYSRKPIHNKLFISNLCEANSEALLCKLFINQTSLEKRTQFLNQFNYLTRFVLSVSYSRAVRRAIFYCQLLSLNNTFLQASGKTLQSVNSFNLMLSTT